jgi:protein SERAC1
MPITTNYLRDCHITIMNTCLDYINITELDALIAARSGPYSLQKWEPGYAARDLSPSPSADEEKKRLAGNSVFKAIQLGFGASTGVDIDSWVLENSTFPGRNSLDEGRPLDEGRQSPTKFSTTGRSQVLQDYPALLSYATSQFFIHARLAQQSRDKKAPEDIIARLLNDGGWGRLAVLKETIPPWTRLRSYAEHIGLSTWVDYINELVPRAASASLESRSLGFQDEIISAVPWPAARRGSGSVASFSSAGSHQE